MTSVFIRAIWNEQAKFRRREIATATMLGKKIQSHLFIQNCTRNDTFIPKEIFQHFLDDCLGRPRLPLFILAQLHSHRNEEIIKS